LSDDGRTQVHVYGEEISRPAMLSAARHPKSSAQSIRRMVCPRDHIHWNRFVTCLMATTFQPMKSIIT
jgi:hypothetical protein